METRSKAALTVSLLVTKKFTIDAQNVSSMARDQDIAHALIKTPEGLKLLAESKDPSGYSTALHKVVSDHVSIAHELIKTPAGIKLLKETKRTNDGWSALYVASTHPTVAMELRRIAQEDEAIARILREKPE